MSLHVDVDQVVSEVPCRVCHVDVGESCVQGGGDASWNGRDARYRADHPHRVRVGDAKEAIFGRRW